MSTHVHVQGVCVCVSQHQFPCVNMLTWHNTSRHFEVGNSPCNLPPSLPASHTHIYPHTQTHTEPEARLNTDNLLLLSMWPPTHTVSFTRTNTLPLSQTIASSISRNKTIHSLTHKTLTHITLFFFLFTPPIMEISADSYV